MPHLLLLRSSFTRAASAKRIPFKSVSLPLAAAVLVWSTPRASAVVDTFNGTVDNSLTNSANYTTAPGTTSDVLLASTATALTLSGAPLTAESLNVTNGSSYTIQNISTTNTRTINLASSGGDAVTGSAAGDLIYLANNSSLSTLTNTQTINVSLGSSGNFDVANGSTLSIATPVVSTAAVTLTVTGGGSVSLLGANTFTGAVMVTGNTLLVLGKSNTYAGATTVNAGSTLQLGNGGASGSVSNSAITDNGTVTVNRSDTVSESGLTTGSGISGSGGFTQAGTGLTQFGYGNSYTGTTLISAGTLSIGNGTNNAGSISPMSAIVDNSILAFNRTGPIVQGTAFSSAAITGTGSIVEAGGGTIGTGATTLNVANSFTGTTTVSGGTLKLANTTGAALSATSQIFVNTKGTLLMGANNQLNATTPAPVQLSGVAGTGTAATFGVGGFSQGSTTANGVGMLTLAASSANNVIDFGSANTSGLVTFAGLTTNGATLTINNYVNNSGASGGPDELIFNGDQTGNLSNIIFTGYGASTEQLVSGTAGTSNAFYEVFPTAVPEPGTVYGMLFMLGAAGWTQRRRLGLRPGVRHPFARR